jgi:hypothetical protein
MKRFSFKNHGFSRVRLKKILYLVLIMIHKNSIDVFIQQHWTPFVFFEQFSIYWNIPIDLGFRKFPVWRFDNRRRQWCYSIRWTESSIILSSCSISRWWCLFTWWSTFSCWCRSCSTYCRKVCWKNNEKLIMIIVWFRCILGRLHSKVCILVTHQIQFLKYATKIILLEKVIRRENTCSIIINSSLGCSNRYWNLYGITPNLSGIHSMDWNYHSSITFGFCVD